jgi:guanylate kinase
LAEPLIFIVSGPSGSGKSSLVKLLLELDERLHFSVSYTTREPRPGEVNGEHYHFLSQRADFEDLIGEGWFFEHAEYNSHYYGTPRRALDEARESGKDLVLDIDVQGVARLKENPGFPKATTIFVLPPSQETLVRRLEKRGDLKPAQKESRLERANEEVPECTKYDYVLVNDRLKDSVLDLLSIVRAARVEQARMAPQIADVLGTFGVKAQHG